MTLYVGRHMIGMNQKRDKKYPPVEPADWEAADPNSEAHVEFEIISLGPQFQARNNKGEFEHTDQMVLLRKVK